MTIKLVHPEVQGSDDYSDESAQRHVRNINIIDELSDFGDPALLPKREFIYGKHYQRGVVSATVADGGVGKTMLAIAEGVAIAMGLNLLGVPVPERCPVLYINLEEPAIEIKRRVHAVCQKYGIDPKELKYGIDPKELNDWFSYQSGLDHPIVAASMERGQIVAGDLPRAFDIWAWDVLIIDPFVGCHRVSENDNTAIDLVMKQFSQIAAANNMAVEIVHHVRKPAQGGQFETGVSDARGASALVNAARSVRVLNAMTEAEAQQGRLATVTVTSGQLTVKRTTARWAAIPGTTSTR